MLAQSAAAAEPFAIGPFPEKWTWPISGTEQPDPIAYSFGPRRFRMDQRYDFSRGLDLQVDKGTEVRAVLDGEVRIAGSNPAYKQPLVQLRHRKPGAAGNAEGGAKFFYTNYMYLDEATVKEGDQVKQGAAIGRSGLSPNGYQRMRFEIRDGASGQANAVHPLSVLPYPNPTAPRVQITSVQPGPKHSVVEVLVTTDAGEPDFARLELEFTIAGREPTHVVYDLVQWNRLYSPKDKSADPLDQPQLNGLELNPEFFQLGADYRLTIRFTELPPIDAKAAKVKGAIKVTAKAVDAGGKSAEAKHP
jgi:hypothetical protein